MNTLATSHNTLESASKQSPSNHPEHLATTNNTLEGTSKQLLATTQHTKETP